jgi:ABC-type nitrate/sulfonate/bicarbonate transport system substrate-binding protein
MVGGIDKQIYLPYQLAQSLGFYKKYGVNVELSTEQNGGVGAEEAMASGQVDMAGAWYIHTIDFQSKGKDVIDLVQLSGAPGERIMCSPKSGVKSAADFKGKTMGVTDLGSGTDELTQFLASQKGVDHLLRRVVVSLHPIGARQQSGSRPVTAERLLRAVRARKIDCRVCEFLRGQRTDGWLGGHDAIS